MAGPVPPNVTESVMSWKLSHPSKSWGPRQVRLVRADEAVGVYRVVAIEGLPGGEIWATPSGRVLVLESLGRLCPCLQTVAGLNFDEVLILYPQDSQIDLRGVMEFLLFRTKLKVTVDAGEDQWAEAQGLMEDLSREYQPPDYPPSLEPRSWLTRVWKGALVNPRLQDQVEEAARSLLWYEAERDPLQMRSALHLLRHLDQVALCARVLEIHTPFYRDGVFETHKDYPSLSGVKVVGRNLQRLYGWADTPAWRKARGRRRLPGLPEVWRPSPVQTQPLAQSAFLKDAAPSPQEPEEYEDFVNEFDLPRLGNLRAGSSQFRDYILSNALYGEVSALAVVACLEDALGKDGVKAMLQACGAEQEPRRRIAHRWVTEGRLGKEKLEAYLSLREDQAVAVPPIGAEDANQADQALYRFFTEGTARDEDAQVVAARVRELLNQGLRHRLNQRLGAMPPGWLKLLYPHLGDSRWLARMSELEYPRADMTLAALVDMNAGSTRFYWPRIEREELRGRHLLHLCADLVAAFDPIDHLVSLWRPWSRRTQVLDAGFHFDSPTAYSPRHNLLLSVQSDPGLIPEVSLLESGLPTELNPKRALFRCRATDLQFSPSQEYLACWGTQGRYLCRTGEWGQPAFLGAEEGGCVSFSPDERYLLAGRTVYALAGTQEMGRLEKTPHDVAWTEDGLIVRSGDFVEFFELPSLQRLGRIGGLRPGAVTLQPDWCLVAREQRLERFAYPALERTATYDVRADRALLTPDQKVLLTLHPDGYMLKVKSWDAETLVELGCSDSFPARGSGFRLSPDGRFAVIREATLCHVLTFCADHRVTLGQADAPGLNTPALKGWKSLARLKL